LSYAVADMAFVTARDWQTRLSTPAAFSDRNVFQLQSECTAQLTSCPARCLVPSCGITTTLSGRSYSNNIQWRFIWICVRFYALSAKLRKATVSFVRSVCPNGTQLSLDGFS